MIRTALRLAAVATLQNGGAAPWPTLAEDNVFDSRGDAWDDMQPGERKPVIVVRTLDDRAPVASPSGRRIDTGPRSIELRLAFGVLAAFKPEGNEPPLVTWPVTEAGLESTLDLMEWDIRAALWGFGDWALWFQNLAGLYPTEIDSLPNFASPEDGRVRLALRDLVVTFRAPHDCLPKPARAADLPKDSAGHPIPPVPALPDYLTAVFDRIEALGGGDLKTAAAAIRRQLEARILPAVAVKPMLTRIAGTLPHGLAYPGGPDSYSAELLGAP